MISRRIQDKHEKRKSLLAKVAKGAVILGVVGLGYWGLDKVLENRQKNHILNNPTGMYVETISPGDTYWSIAREMRNENPELKKFSTDRIAWELRKLNNYSPGKLQPGEKIFIPKYD